MKWHLNSLLAHTGRGLLRSMLVLCLVVAVPQSALALVDDDEETDTADTDEATPNYVNLMPFLVTVIQRGRILGQLVVAVKLEAESSDAVDRIVAQKARVRDALLSRISWFGENRTNMDKVVDGTLLGRYLQLAVDKVLVEDKVTVWITNLQVRKF